MAETHAGEPADNRIAVSVVHGHLAFARYPVLVGHYKGDTFAGTEARLDRALGGRLTERRHLGLYPGEIGTSAVLLDPTSRPRGAVVVGLGEPADLSIGDLSQTLRQGILAFAAATMDRRHSEVGAADTAERLGLSALLVGAGEGGLGRNGCVRALLKAASQAQLIIGGLDGFRARLAFLEIVELHEDRAYATWRALKEAHGINVDPTGGFMLTSDIVKRRGGRGHARLGRDPDWWQPIQITMSRPDIEERGLTFTIGGGLARAEARTIAANLDLVGPLLRRAFRNVDLDDTSTSPGRALFELLWPDSLKDRSAEERHRRLILDEASAAFPWELLDDRRPWNRDDTGPRETAGPPAVRAGMIRQLLQAQFREPLVAAHGGSKALVIGNPTAVPTDGFPDLPGAEKEARTIAAALAKNDRYRVTPLVAGAATPEQICKQLFTQAWEIVHIAAHGVVNEELPGPNGAKRRVTGIMLGGGVVLGPSALSRLPISPTIVFISCCHLGRIDAAAEAQSREAGLEGRPELAASVAVELIRHGVRGVVVAGWAVDDDAAAAFGETFYAAMLDGARFGEATLRARQAAYTLRRDSNTWGAYQCYGDPDFRLRDALPKPDDLATLAEALETARQIREDINVGLERDLVAQRDRVAKIETAAEQRDWLGSADLRIALAEARSELNDLPEAVGHYAAGVGSADPGIKVKAVEQLANLRIREAVTAYRATPPGSRDLTGTVATIEGVQETLHALITAVGPSAERLSLQGGCWKRLAQVQTSGPQAGASLQRMAECYDRAAAMPGGDPEYSRLMACNARICIALRDGADGRGCDSPLIEALMRADPPDDADFWQFVRQADAQQSMAIMRAPAPFKTEEVRETYRRAWRHIGSPLKLRSVIEQLDFYEDIFSEGTPATAPARRSIVEWVAELRAFIEAEFAAPKSA